MSHPPLILLCPPPFPPQGSLSPRVGAALHNLNLLAVICFPAAVVLLLTSITPGKGGVGTWGVAWGLPPGCRGWQNLAMLPPPTTSFPAVGAFFTLGTYTIIFLKLFSFRDVNLWCRERRGGNAAPSGAGMTWGGVGTGWG